MIVAIITPPNMKFFNACGHKLSYVTSMIAGLFMTLVAWRTLLEIESLHGVMNQ